MQKVPNVVILRTGNMKFYKGVRLDVDADWDVMKNTISIE